MQRCGKSADSKKKYIFLMVSLVLMTSVTGCRKLPETREYQEKVAETVHITGDLSDTIGYHVITEEEIVEKYLKDKGVWTEPEDGFRWEVMICDTDVYRADIITNDDGTFRYRNVQYNIQSWTGDNYIRYQLPGECSAYYVRFWTLE